MLTALGGSGRLGIGALIGAAVAALLAVQGGVVKSPRGLSPSDAGEIVVVKGSEQPGRTITGTGTTTSVTGSSRAATTTSVSSTSGTTTTTTSGTSAGTTTTTTTTTTRRPTTTMTTTRRPTTTTTTTTTRRRCGIIFC
ncbi:hypothetical protein AB0G02_06055 [Actinosynnema sp. NPDC023658]|uniref:hypothetical protein n=1 Tax=Actinosynnema sp. NPDC023658 TaxID=3155465 RepID=UPI0033C09333